MGMDPVAYRLIQLEDRSRTPLPDTAGTTPGPSAPRVLPVRIWQPATARSMPPRMTFAHIVGMNSPDSTPVTTGLRARTISIHEYAARRYASAGDVPADAIHLDTVGLVRRALAVRTHAMRGAASPSARRRPLVLFAGGIAHSTDENVALWEYLASHGYIVAALPAVAIEASAESAYLPASAAALETIARDLEVTLAHFRTRPDVDTGRVAVAGFSFGGAAALAMAARHRSVRAVVGFDASFIARRHLPTIMSAPLFDAARIRAPILEFHRADSAGVDLSLLQSAVRTTRHSIELSDIDHIDFNSYALLYAPLLRSRIPRSARDSVLDLKVSAYRAMVETTRLFLDQTLGAARVDSTQVARALGAESAAWTRLPPSMIRARHWSPTR